MIKSQILYQKQGPSVRVFPVETVLFYDSVLLKNKKTKAWLQKFPFQVPLKSGEKLKSLESLEQILKKLAKLPVPQTTQLTFVAVGGGSVGDFVGFLASIFLRGRALVHIPSTWLAAIDSAHGGKNGLNAGSTKNQLGTFYPAAKIYIVKDLLQTQPKVRIQEAMGEVVKMAVIGQSALFRQIENNVFNLNSAFLLKQLPQLIQQKNKIVAQDPYEIKGLRRNLNLGHTMGHVFEAHYGWPHGLCVLLGTLFSIRWSYHLGLADEKTYVRVSNLIEDIWPEQKLSDDLFGIPIQVLVEKLRKDKKLTAKSEIDFIFIKRIGKVLRKKVSIESIINEVKRQMTEY